MTPEVRFTDDGILFESYPIVGASVYPRGFVALGVIADIDPDDHPPSLRTREGEVLFLPVTCRDELRRWMARHDLIPWPHEQVHLRRQQTYAEAPPATDVEVESEPEPEPPPEPRVVDDNDD
ncbi:MAG: hypothetical protein HS108_07785 [Planctomycetes bacterium]|jgi:hypothetical protein|nr:hypothetical protein [Planctomycetota bacterium]MCL4729684.1 hypothetical protein [Planctomycetota bacterium]